MLVADSGEVNN